jgi:hypothetical protein
MNDFLEIRRRLIRQFNHPNSSDLSGASSIRSHLNGIVCVANNIPTGLRSSLGKEGVAARHILFGMNLVEFVSSSTALIRNGQKTNAMNGSCGGTELGNMETKLIPGKVRKVEKREQNEQGKHDASPGKNRTRWENG